MNVSMPLFYILSTLLVLLGAGCSRSGSEGLPNIDSLVPTQVEIHGQSYAITEYQTQSEMPDTKLILASDFLGLDQGFSIDWSDIGIPKEGAFSLTLSFSTDSSDRSNDTGPVIQSWSRSYTRTQLLETDVYYLSFIPEYHPVTVGLLGTGVDLDLARFSGFSFQNTQEIANNGVDDDQNGVIDDGAGAGFLINDHGILTATNDASDSRDHDTYVASIIASLPLDEVNFRGISDQPGLVSLLPIKCINDKEDLNDSAHEAAIRYAIDAKVPLLNASFGKFIFPDTISDAYQDALDQGMVIVAAVGNDGVSTPHLPCNYHNVICVGGTDSLSKIWSRSSWGAVDFVSYASDVLIGGPLAYGSGTSFSTPIITSAISKIMSYSGNYTRAYAYDLLARYAQDLQDPLNRDGLGVIDFKGLSEEFVSFSTYLLSFPQYPQLHLSFMVATDRHRDTVTRAELQYLYLNQTRYSIHRVLYTAP